jgi:hypothetical protein
MARCDRPFLSVAHPCRGRRRSIGRMKPAASQGRRRRTNSSIGAPTRAEINPAGTS